MADIRNTKVIDVVRELESFNVKVDVLDHKADADEVKEEYDLDLWTPLARGIRRCGRGRESRRFRFILPKANLHGC